MTSTPRASMKHNRFARALQQLQELKAQGKLPAHPKEPDRGSRNKGFKHHLHGLGFTKEIGKQADRAQAKLTTPPTPEPKTYPPLKVDEIRPENEIPGSILTDAQFFVKKAEAITLDESQQAALDGMMAEYFSCLIGPAGCGKSTVSYHYAEMIKETLRQWYAQHMDEKRDPIIYACSYTGQSTRVLATHLPMWMRSRVATIHRTLGYHPEYVTVIDEETGLERETMRFLPEFTEYNKLNADIIIIDEAGNIPVWLYNQLQKALHPHCMIVLIGDINQLPPVQGRSILGYAMQKWPTFELAKIHRQAEGNPIIRNAHRVLHGQPPVTDRARFLNLEFPDGGNDAFRHILILIQKLKDKGEFDPFQDALIVPQNKDTLGQLELNHRLVAMFNPPRKYEGGIVNPRIIISYAERHKAFAVGDKIMLLQNLNDIGLTNGMTGKIISITTNGRYHASRNARHFQAGYIARGGEFDELSNLLAKINSQNGESKLLKELVRENGMRDTGTTSAEEATDRKQRQASHIVTCQIEGELVDFSTVGQIEVITHAYAQTCHKSQGQEYRNVVILCHSAAGSILLSREWLYTAITRAKERVVLCHNPYGLQIAVNRQRITGKTLQEKAQNFLIESSTKEDLIPILPDAMKR